MYKRTTHSIVMMLIALLVGIGLAPNATAANSANKTKVVHQGGTVAVAIEREVVDTVLDDDACGKMTDRRHSITYRSLDCAVGNYRADVTVRNDNGSLSDIDVVFLVRKNHLTEAGQIEEGLVRIINGDAKDPIRCDYNRNGDVVYGRFIPADGFVDIQTRDDELKRRCYYRDGASAGEGTISVVQLSPRAYLYPHPKSETITAGLNNTSGNVHAEFKYIPPGDNPSIIVVEPGDFPRPEFPFQESGEYRIEARMYNGEWEEVASVYVDVHSP